MTTLTDNDLYGLECFYEGAPSGTELFKLACILLNTFEEGAEGNNKHETEEKLS